MTNPKPTYTSNILNTKTDNSSIEPNLEVQRILSRISTTNSSIRQQRHLSLQPNTPTSPASPESPASPASPASFKYSSLLSSNSMKNMNITNPTNSQSIDILKLIENYTFKNKGIFKSKNITWANHHTNIHNYDLIKWKLSTLEISSKGLLSAGNSTLIKNLQECKINLTSKYFIIKITTTDAPSNCLLFKFNDVYKYIEFLSCLIIWKNLKSNGLKSKLNYIEPINYINTHLNVNLEFINFEVHGPRINNTGNTYAWFTCIGHLLPTGILNLYKDDENEIIYSVDLTKLFNFEIQILNNSISKGNGGDVLYIGIIDELRGNQSLPSSLSETTRKSILKGVDINCDRILIKFNTSNDLKNWYTNFLKFTNQEYLKSAAHSPNKKIRLNKYVKLEIIDSQFNDDTLINSLLYCELIIWNKVWFRTSVVKVDGKLNVFWKDSIRMDLPISDINSNFKIVIKKITPNGSVNDKDIEDEFEDSEIIGFLMLNLDITRNEICKFQILNLQNKKIGELMINLNMKSTFMLPNLQYKNFENILKNISIESIIKQIECQITSGNLEYYSTILINVFEKLNKIDDFFHILIKYEFNKLHKVNLNKQNFSFKFNSLFRGNSILSKSLEIYALRIGTPYLQNLLKDFIELIITEDFKIENEEGGDYDVGYNKLLKYIEILWNKIYNSSNDLPMQIKKQWKSLRLNIELLNDDISYLYNGLNSFIFLRFLCPSILNPKLYNILNVKYNENVQNTLNLISKTIMIFSMRLKFQSHKDPNLIKLNEDFILRNDDELVEFLDNVTLKKLDFHEKKFNLTDVVETYDFENYEIDLPPSFDLINKFLNYSQLIELLKTQTETKVKEDEKVGIDDYQIKGFEVNDDEDFLTSIIKDEDNEILSGLIKNDGEKFKIEDLVSESNSIFLETSEIVNQLNDYEIPELYIKNGEFEEFIETIIKRMKLNYEEVIFNDDDGYQDINKFINLIVKENNKPKVATIKLSSSSTSIPEPTFNTTSNKRSIFKSIFRRKSTIQ